MKMTWKTTLIFNERNKPVKTTVVEETYSYQENEYEEGERKKSACDEDYK